MAPDEAAELHERLRRLHEAMVEELARLSTRTEQAVTAAAASVGAVVQVADCQAAALREARHEAEAELLAPLRGLLAQDASAMGEASRDVALALREIDDRRRRLAERLGEVKGVLAALRELRLTCSALAGITKVEVARLGSEDQLLAAVAGGLQQMRDLIDELLVAVEGRVGELLVRLARADAVLHEVERLWHGQEARLGPLRRAMDDGQARLGAALGQVVTVTGEASGELVTRAHDALSRMQFADPLLQRLQRNDGSFARLRVATQGAPAGLSPEPLRFAAWLSELAPAEEAGAGAVAAETGEVLLF